MKKQRSNNWQAHVSRKVMLNQNPSFSLSEKDIAIYRALPLQIRSGVRSGDKQSCEAAGGDWECSGAAPGTCKCSDNGTGDWD